MTERTPAGGDRSEITFLDANGNPVDSAADAVEAEIREYVGDVMIRRTYMEAPRADRTPTWTPPGQAVGEPDAYDFAKNTWDVWANDEGSYRLATTTDSLLQAVGLATAPEAEQRDFLINLMRLPSWNAAPLELKQDVTHWLATH